MNGPFAARKHDEGDGIVRLALHGEIDHDVSAALDLIIVNAVEQDGIEALVIDLDRVPFLAAAGIRSLLDGRRTALRRGCACHVVNAKGVVAEVLDAAGVGGLLLSPAPAARRRIASRIGPERPS